MLPGVPAGKDLTLSTTHSRSTVARTAAIACFVVAMIVLFVVAGCSGDPATTSTTGSAATTSSSESPTSTTPVTLSDLDTELARTAKARNALSTTLDDIDAPKSDPRVGLSYALHARAQAIGCVQMLQKGDQASLDIADGVMLDIYHQMNYARDLSTGGTADIVGAARVIADKIGAPSNHAEEAEELLNQFVEALSPLWQELKAVYSQVIIDKPTYVNAYMNLAQILVEERDKDGALAVIEKGIAATTGDDKADLEKIKETLTGATATT